MYDNFDDQIVPRRLGRFAALGAFLSKDVFARGWAADCLAQNIESNDLRAMYVGRGWPTHKVVAEWHSHAVEMRRHLIGRILSSMLQAILLMCLALGIALVLGKVAPDRKFRVDLVLQFVGLGITSLSGLLTINKPIESMGGTALHERLHSSFCGFFLAFGSAMAGLGILLAE